MTLENKKQILIKAIQKANIKDFIKLEAQEIEAAPEGAPLLIKVVATLDNNGESIPTTAVIEINKDEYTIIGNDLHEPIILSTMDEAPGGTIMTRQMADYAAAMTTTRALVTVINETGNTLESILENATSQRARNATNAVRAYNCTR